MADTLQLSTGCLGIFDHESPQATSDLPGVGRQVRRLANMATQGGLRGLVCSPLEVAELRQLVTAGVQLVTPGVRSQTSPADDQKRTLSPREAIAAGANWLVIGRPIYAAPDPRAAAEKILESLK